MLSITKMVAEMWKQRWQAMRQDEGATVIEYAILVLMGFLVAGALAVVVTDAVKSRQDQIK
jgi:Flp pilus assembly pilin Flp